MAEERRKEYFICPFSDVNKPRMCPAKHMNAGWKCPLERGSECAIWKIAEELESKRVGY
jgi:hypothetical protein